MAGANVPYNPVPTVESQGNLGGGQSAHASAQDFGGQLGEAVQKAGDTGFDLAMKQQGMINETMMTNADADFATKVGKIKGDYQSLTGMAAYNAFPQYQEDIKAAFHDSRGGLPPAAQHGFDMMATRTMANHVADGSSYAASQLKEANRDAYSNVANASLQSLLDPSIASNPERADYHLDTLKYAAQAQVDEDHPGLKTDPETGKIDFDDSTPEGQLGRAQLQQKLDGYLSQGHVNKYTALSKLDLMGSYTDYLKERDEMPKSAQVALDSSYAPKIFNAHANTATASTLGEAAQGHWNVLTNPSSAASNSYNLGNVKTPGGAAAGTADFVHPATPTDGVILTANTLRTGYQGLSLSQIGAKWAPSSENKTSDWVKNVSSVSGIVPDAKPDLNDPTQLSSLLKGIAAAEKSPADRALFTDDVISSGVQASLSGKKPSSSPQTEKTYATNENGGPLSLADYYRTHSQDILAKGDAYAESQLPGDLALKRAVRQSLQNQMNQTIANESAQHTLDNRNVMRAINGEFTQGKPPETEEQLRTIPHMADLLDNIAARDPKFAESIPVMIAKVASRNENNNSSNAYGTVLRVLSDEDNPNAIRSEDHLVRELGRSDGTGINKKDYNDAKPAIELDQTLKDALAKGMKNITNANGNIDGKGQDRAMAWYNQTMAAWKQNTRLGDKATSPSDFVQQLQDNQASLLPHSPSRMQQISNWASSLWDGKRAELPLISSPSDQAFIKLPPGAQFKTADGQIRTKK